jgi:hypothetical protein
MSCKLGLEISKFDTQTQDLYSPQPERKTSGDNGEVVEWRGESQQPWTAQTERISSIA